MWIAQKEVTGVEAEALVNIHLPPPLPPPIDAIAMTLMPVDATAMPAMPVGIPPDMAVMSSEWFNFFVRLCLMFILVNKFVYLCHYISVAQLVNVVDFF